MRGLSLAQVFKDAMARVSAQAMILTSGSAMTRSHGALHGMTLSSVCLLSVAPQPLLQFNLHLPSYTSAALHASEYMCLHVMPPTRKSVFLGRVFASGVKTDSGHFSVKDGEFHERTTPFARISQKDYYMHTRGDCHVPVLHGLEVAFVCKKRQTFTVDNHEIWVVEVAQVLTPNPLYREKKSGGLLYYQRGFHAIGRGLKE